MRLLSDGGLTGATPARCVQGGVIGAKNLHLSVDRALLEAAKRLDEEGRRADSDDNFDHEAERAVEAGLKAVLRRDYESARAAFERAEALGESSALVKTNLQRLRGLLAD